MVDQDACVWEAILFYKRICLNESIFPKFTTLIILK